MCSLWQRINVMQSLRALAGDAYILYFLFTTYDLKQARKLSCCAFVSVLHAICHVTWFHADVYTLGTQHAGNHNGAVPQTFTTHRMRPAGVQAECRDRDGPMLCGRGGRGDGHASERQRRPRTLYCRAVPGQSCRHETLVTCMDLSTVGRLQ